MSAGLKPKLATKYSVIKILVEFQCDLIWWSFSTMANFKSSANIYLVQANYGTYIVQFFATGSIFIAENGQLLANNLAIWSHWSYSTKMK